MRQERYKLVADEIATAIRAGHLPAGTRLPTHRELALQRGIALATATKAYRELAAAGLTVGEAGRGTYVRDLSGFAGLEPRRLPVHARTADLSFNQPVSVEQVEQLRRALRDLAGEGDLGSLLVQQPPGGRTTDKAAVATHLLDVGIDVAPSNVLLTAGAQHGLDVVLASATNPGSTLAVRRALLPWPEAGREDPSPEPCRRELRHRRDRPAGFRNSRPAAQRRRRLPDAHRAQPLGVRA